MYQKVRYKGEELTLKMFEFTNEPCLWINNPKQIKMPKMEFVGGYPNEYCIFLKNLTPEEKEQITNLDGSKLDLEKILSNYMI